LASLASSTLHANPAAATARHDNAARIDRNARARGVRWVRPVARAGTAVNAGQGRTGLGDTRCRATI
jgi:hypothetical protein